MRAGWHNILLWRKKFSFLPYPNTSEAVAHPLSHQLNPAWLQSPEKNKAIHIKAGLSCSVLYAGCRRHGSAF